MVDVVVPPRKEGPGYTDLFYRTQEKFQSDMDHLHGTPHKAIYLEALMTVVERQVQGHSNVVSFVPKGK